MDRCVCCGKYVPEGKMVCWACENEVYNSKERDKTMDVHTATEIAYKNGYEKGFEEGYKKSQENNYKLTNKFINKIKDIIMKYEEDNK